MLLSDFDINGFIETHLNIEADHLDRMESARKSIKNTFKLFDKGSGHVFEYFPLEAYGQEDIAKVLMMIEGNKDLSRKALYLLNEVNANYDLSSWKIESDYGHQKSLKEMVFDYQPFDIESSRKLARDFIRQNGHMIKELVDQLLLWNDEIYSYINEEQSLMWIQLSDYKNYEYLLDYLQYTVDLALQLIIYGIVANNDLEDSRKLMVLELIEGHLISMEETIDHNIKAVDLRKLVEVNDIAIEDAMDVFMFYVQKRNEYGEHIRVFDTLLDEEQEEPQLFKQVEAPYITSKAMCDVTQIKDIILEGTSDRDYHRKLNEVMQMILIFSRYGERDVYPDNTQDIKVYYRELYISKSKYKKRAMSIARDYLQQVECDGKVSKFKMTSEYLFLREKISRGYFREKNLLALYHKKNRIQEIIYRSWNKTLLSYDFNSVLDALYTLNSHVLKTIGMVVEQ